MSKRHQSSRRKTYGRRQHEVRERHDKTPQDESTGHFELDDWSTSTSADPVVFLDPTTPRYRYALGD
ncbi:MAG: hypothetical protein ABIP77_04215 [Candidatus Limnocylindrales bacterium]